MLGSPVRFSKIEFDALSSLVFRPGYPGYKPNVVEAPNGDGKLDTDKRYSHVAIKYIRGGPGAALSEIEYLVLHSTLTRCHVEALRVHDALGLPEAWAPDLDASALRILEYPPGATSARHTDFDLFTLVAYRDPFPGGLVRHEPEHRFEDFGKPSLGFAEGVSPGIHFGELYELGGFGRATPHEVGAIDDGSSCITSVKLPQFSAVYFALPRHDLVKFLDCPLGLFLDLAARYNAAESHDRLISHQNIESHHVGCA